jgi:D-glycero-D-manno-heptose 1,7-bisphosphate phosphatase
MNVRLKVMVEEAGARLEGIYYCPHAPGDGCLCRKPAPGLLLQAASDLGFNPASAVIIGDKESDIEFGRRAGARTVLIATNAPAPHVRTRADVVAVNLMEATQAVTSLRD